MCEAAAQTLEAVGARALGMGGAFVAVADDGSAVYWNPAGLATGPYFEVRFEHQSARKDPGPDGPDPKSGRERGSSQFFSLSIPVIGLSYYRLGDVSATIQPVQLAATAEGVLDRENQGSAQLAIASIVTHHVGLTVVQSVSDRLAVATTMKAVIGTARSMVEKDEGRSPFDRADELAGKTTTSFDLDAGALATLGAMRVGVVVRNLRAPEFASAEGRSGGVARTFEFRRQARIGVAVMPDQGRRPNPTTLALDVDLTRQRALTAERRNVAVGMEQWLMSRRVGLRGGVRA
ncbi:MAG: conjugal transfer protein TraF, partial [Acidobacteria bacterium]|nr:conjugal transfer protein TraF [Acidobacteriota bacterium]